MPETERTGICIIGAGPAGSALAIRLAQLGHAVCLVERSAFPRPHLGESLSPGVWPQFEVLEASAAIAAAGFRPGRHAVIRWERATAEIREFGQQPALIVDRGRFDRLLLELARSHGVRILQPASILERRRSDMGWRLHIKTEGRAVDLEAAFLADASGRANALRGHRRPTGPRTLALYGYWRDAELPPEPCIEAGENEWYWGVPLPDGTYNAIVFVDMADLRTRPGATSTAFYRRLIGSSHLLVACRGARLVSDVRAADATPYIAAETVGRDCIKLGEAALAIDPLSSSGVEKSIQTGLAGAIVVNTLLRRPQLSGAAQCFYRQSLIEVSDRHRSWAAGFYKLAAERRQSKFWQTRAAPCDIEAGGPSPAFEPAPSVWGAPIALSPLAELLDLPCIVGDLIAIDSVLRHPGIERPVAYLDGFAVAPLLRRLKAGMTPLDLVRSWSVSVPMASAVAIARFLLSHGVLTAADGPH
jgi:flavin-dependent dehydrogenase